MSSWSLRTQALALVLGLVTGGCEAGVIGVVDGDGDLDDDHHPGEPPIASAWTPAPPPAPLPEQDVAAAAEAIDDLLASVSYSHSVKVENATTGQLIAASDAGRMLKPASNTKLFTTAAAFETIGDDAGLELTAYATGPIGADGRLAGDLVIVGGHDLTASRDFYGSPRGPFDGLAGQLARAGLRSVDGEVVVSGEYVYEGAPLGSLDVGAERASVVGPIRAALAAAGIAIGAVSSSSALEPPAGAALIVRHAPITIVAASSATNVPSHNEYADLLVRRIGYLDSGESSYAAGGRAVLAWLGSFGAPLAGAALNDGSGLSHGNRVSADLILALLAHMDEGPLGETWRRTLAIAGVRGTIGGRMTGADTAGRVFAKTGTLSDTIALSGYVANRHDGQRYRFAVLFNAVGSSTTARARADAIASVVARDLRGSDPRPAPPRLDLVRGVGWAGYLEIGWQPVGGAIGYLVWLSDDGRRWRRADARLIAPDTTRVVFDDLGAGGATYARVTALAADGLESDPSQVLVGWASSEPAEVLLVDADERWRAGPMARNTLGENHDFLVGVAAATPGRRVDSASNHAVVADAIELADYPVVMWALGEESSEDDVMSEAEQDRLTPYVTGGGGLLVSASELLYGLDTRAEPADQRFAADVLHARYLGDDAGTHEIEGVAGTAFAELPLASFAGRDQLTVDFPDLLAPGDGGEALIRYVGGAAGAAMIGHRDVGRVIVTGFPIEALLSTAVRGQLLETAYEYLGL